jgi:DNA-binding NarL/FixJ family response regulator
MNYSSDLESEYKIIIVDSDKSCRSNTKTFLNNYFQDITLASNWIECFQKMKDNPPDIIITDISTSNAKELEIIKKIKKLDEDTEIIITAAHFDTKNLLEALHIGVTDFIPKPIDNIILKEAITKAFKHLKNSKSLENKIAKKVENIYAKLNEAKNKNINIELINYYKGVPIIRLGRILNIENDIVEIELDPVQLKAIIYEKFTSLEMTEFNKSFVGEFYSCNRVKSTVKLKNIKSILYSPKRRVLVRVATNDNFVLKVFHNNKTYNAKATDISTKSISFNIDKDKNPFIINDEFKLHFEIHQTNNITKSSYGTIIIESMAHVYKTYTKREITNIVATFNLDTEMQKKLNSYISSRELELVNEFKDLLIKMK